MAKAKVSSVVPGQVGDIQRQSIEAQKAIEAPRQAASNLDALLEAPPVAPSAPEIAPAVEAGVLAGLEAEERLGEQRERERVQPIQERYADQQRVDVYDHTGERARMDAIRANSGPSSDGGLKARANNMATMVTEGQRGLRLRQDMATAPILQKISALDETGKKPNFDFLKVASVVTENTIADLAFNEGEAVKTEYDPFTGEEKEIAGEGKRAITKLDGAINLGKTLSRDWQRMQNAAAGRPTDEYTELTDDEALILGDAAKELYYETNKMDEGEQFLIRSLTEDGKAAFMLTKHGADRLKQGTGVRKRLFPKQHIRPSKTPLPRGRFQGEAQVYTKRISKKSKAPAGMDTIDRAMTNLNKVANVVDKQRLKILLSTVIPVLKNEIDADHPFAIINHVGKDKLDELTAKEKMDPEFNAAEEYETLVHNLAQSVFGVAQEAEGANYLTYYVQAFNGRIAPQQTHFDPTSSKSVRFVTRNAVPAKATPGSRVERNLRQMYAMMLVKGADGALPAERDRLLEQATPQLVKWGQELERALGQVTDQQVKDVTEAIKNGVAVTDPGFPTIAVPEISNPELIEAIKKKGEDGQAFIDGLIDFTKYYENKLKGQPHYSYFNAYMDGKTNGLASNGIQMGSEQVAFKTGVLRSQGTRLLDKDEDIRDALKNHLLWSLDDGFDGDVDGFGGELHNIARSVYSDRTLNKKTTMTFGYGMELDSFKGVIDERLAQMEESDPQLKERVALATVNKDRQELVDVLHGKYIGGLREALDENALKSRALMRSAAALHALTNELFVIRSATGFELTMGGTTRGEWEAVGKYDLYTGEGKTGYKEQTVGKLTDRPTSAAEKRRVDKEGELNLEPGGIAYGGSVPAPVQSLDAATVALTASGRSWARLDNASNGKPYLHTIYDAFKVDAMGYDVVLDEVNKNWLNASMDWSYLEETRNAIDSLREVWAEKTKHIPNDTVLSGEDWSMAGYLLTPTKNKQGNITPGNLINKLSKMMEREDDAGIAAKRIIGGMKKVGYNFYDPPAYPTMGHLKQFIKLFANEIDLTPRLNRMINETNNKKKKLRKTIKEAGVPVYQYYSH